MASEEATRSRRGLSREAILEAADAIVADAGLPALTMRSVAERVGAGTMTLYGYFRDKDELLDALIDLKSAQFEIPQSGGPWKQRLRELMLALHRQLVAHPFLATLRLRRPLMSPGALRWTELGVELLGEAGLGPADSARAFRSLFVYTFGHALLLPEGDPEDVVRQAHAALVVLPRDTYPALAAGAADLAGTLTGEDAYLFGLDRLLDGIEAG